MRNYSTHNRVRFSTSRVPRSWPAAVISALVLALVLAMACGPDGRLGLRRVGLMEM